MDKQREMQRQQAAQPCILVLEDEQASLCAHQSRRVLAVASQGAPHLVCGPAFRVGWTRGVDRQPIYRLKVRVQL